MGMNQSAFSQYLRGTIPLNTDFLAKFSQLTGESFLADNVTPSKGISVATLEVIATLSGKKIEKTKQTVHNANSEDNFLIRIDYRSHYLPYGSFLLLSKTAKVREGETAVYMPEGQPFVLGTLELIDDEWCFIEQHFFGARSHFVGNFDNVFRVQQAIYPENRGRGLIKE